MNHKFSGFFLPKLKKIGTVKNIYTVGKEKQEMVLKWSNSKVVSFELNRSIHTIVLFISSGGRHVLGQYFGMTFFDDTRDCTWSGDLPQILTYPIFDLMGVSRDKKFKMKNLKIDFRPEITSQNIVPEEMKTEKD